jgi:hypothetical protein
MTTRQQLDVHAYNELVGRFHEETDRAAGVLAAAYLDAFLEDLLRCVLVSGPKTDEMFAGQGPLRSFGSKIYAAPVRNISRRKDMEAACEEIVAGWVTLKEPPGRGAGGAL